MPATLALVVLLLPTLNRDDVALAASETLDIGIAGPSAVGVPTDLHPSVERSGSSPVQVWELPRRYPVDQAMFERLKHEANAHAAAGAPNDAMPREDVP